MDEPRLSVTMSVQMKVNLGNYESADAFLSVSGVTADTTEEQLAEILDGPGRVSYELLKKHLGERIAEIRATKGAK